MTNGDWVYHITGDEEFVSQIFTLIYDAPISPVQLIEPTCGTFFNARDYRYFETTPAGRFLYGLIIKGETERYLDGDLNDVQCDTIEKAWYDVGINFPKKWNEDNGEQLYDVWPTSANLPIQRWYNADDSLQFMFDDPYYVDEPPEANKRLVATGGQHVGFSDYLYFETNDGRYLYNLVEIGTAIKMSGFNEFAMEYNKIDKTFYNVGGDDPEKWGTYADADETNLSYFPSGANLETQYWFTDDGTLFFQFINPFLIEMPGYKYLGFYGQSGSTHGYLNEIALTLTDGTKIDKNNQIYSDKIKLVAPIRPDLPEGTGENIDGIFDGQISNTPQNALMFKNDESGILLYMEADNNKEVQDGIYSTQGTNISYQIDQGKIYGTNTDPNNFTDPQYQNNWSYICDLTKIPITVQSPFYSYMTVIGIGNANTTSFNLNDFKLNIFTINGSLNGYPPTGGKINVEGCESVSRSDESGLLIDGSDNGYTWSNTSVNTYNTLFTVSIVGILEISGITLEGDVVPEDLIIMIHNLNDNATKEEIELENHNVKYIYSDTTMFDGESEHFSYTRIIPAHAGPSAPVERIVPTGGA
jgi:hypothetical protein